MPRLWPAVSSSIWSLAALSLLGACAPQPTTPASQDPLGRRLDALFEPWNRDDSPGAAVVVLQGGEVLYRRGFGLASLESKERIRPGETLFDIQSVSKQMTAFAVFLLERRGRLSLDQEVRHHLPWVPDFGSPITLRHLVHHTSGLREYLDLASLHRGAKGTSGQDPLGQEDVLAWLRDQQGVNFEPGAASIYCNTGYLLLAEVVAAASGRLFHEFMAEEVFRPLGMSHTRVRTYGAEGRSFETRSYGKRSGLRAGVRGRFVPVPTNLATWGGGGIASTADDLALWLENLRLARVEPEVVSALLRPGILQDGTALAYGGGIRLRRERGLQLFSHGGAGQAFKSWAASLPQQALSIVMLGNSYPGITGLEDPLLGLLLDHFGVAPGPPPPPTSEPPRKWVGHFANEVVWVRISLEQGKLILRSPGSPQGREIDVRADGRFQAGASELTTVFDGAGRITALRFWSGADLYHLQRFEPPAAAPSDWSQAAGAYRSPETGHTVRLSSGPRGLETQIRNIDLVFVPMQADHFFVEAGRPASLRLTRGPDGTISGLLLNFMRSRQLRYERLL